MTFVFNLLFGNNGWLKRNPLSEEVLQNKEDISFTEANF